MTIGTFLFDLDGTLSDSEPGILCSLAAAFVDHGLPPLDEPTGRALLGPPFYESLPPIVGAEMVGPVIQSYRQHYATGKFDTTLYDGAGELLEALQRAGIRLAVATSKPEPQAVAVVEYLGISNYFVAIGGDTPDAGRPTKAAVVAEVLARLDDPDPASVLMVGDRRHDVVGAAAHGVACLGAGWGYGVGDELQVAGAIEVFAHPVEITTALPRLL